MLPLIDIVFLLLVVFIYAMLSMTVHRGLPVQLPISSSVVIDDDAQNLTVTVQQKNQEGIRLSVDGVPVQTEGVSEALSAGAEKIRRQTGLDPEVLLFADRTVSYEDLFQVLDRIREAGLDRISMQADLSAEK